jgi:hypothetical protein
MDNEIQSRARKSLAKKLAKDLIKAAGIKTIPISLQKIIEHLQGTHSLDVRRIDASNKVSGLLVVCRELDEEYATIGFNGNMPWCRRRFTIAHEIGHLLLGHTCGVQDGSHNETEANTFAAELLVPTINLKKDFGHNQDLNELSKKYCVSDQTLTLRLMETHLV